MIFEGKMIGKPARGRRRLTMLSDLAEKEKYLALEGRAEDRKKWQKL